MMRPFVVEEGLNLIAWIQYPDKCATGRSRILWCYQI